MNEQDPNAVAAEQTPTPENTVDNNAPQMKCGISGVDLKEGDKVVVETVAPENPEQAPYDRVVLLSALELSDEELAALPEGTVKTFPSLN